VSARAEIERLLEEARAAGVSLPEETAGRLESYVQRLREWSSRVNLVSRRELDQIVPKHVGPSLVPLLDEAVDPDGSLVVDVGSGGGFPGLVLALARPGWRLHLVEPRRRKALFLEETGRAAGNVRVWRTRAETLGAETELAGRAACVTARAVARPAEIWPLARPFLTSGGRVHVFVSGDAYVDAARELTDTHADARLLDPLEAPWWRGRVLRACVRSENQSTAGAVEG